MIERKKRGGEGHLGIGIGKQPKQSREGSGIENGGDTGVDAAGKAAKNSSGLDENVGVGSGGENCSNMGDNAELDEGQLLGAVTDDLVLDVSQCLELHGSVGGGQSADELRGRLGNRRRS